LQITQQFTQLRRNGLGITGIDQIIDALQRFANAGHNFLQR
jgi:hypothetical protein